MKLSKRGAKFLRDRLKIAIEIGAKDRAEWENSLFVLQLRQMKHDNPNVSLFGSITGEYEGLDVPQSVLDGLTESIRYSELKEKFMRYAHNWDYDKAKKYHDKTLKWEQESIERHNEMLRDNTEGVLISSIRNHEELQGNDERIEERNEGALIQSANEYKKNFDYRLDVLHKVKDTPKTW